MNSRIAGYMLLPALLISCYIANGQAIADKGLRGNVALLKAIHELKPIEKLYLQTDKPYYTTGDTLRFKAYLLNADYLTPAERSGLLYVELDGIDGKAAKRIMIPVEHGLAWGDIALDSKDIPEGSYTLRAYTNWQRNFGEDYIFKKEISIAATNGSALLVKAGFIQKDGKVESVLQFTSLDGHVQALKDMQLKVMNGRKNVSKDKVTTGIDGTVKVNFDIPEGATIKDLAIKAQDVSKGATSTQELTIPVTINRSGNTDVQFMPEGGQLVAGIKTKVGFKAIAEDGSGTNIAGTITDSKRNEVARFSTAHAGMGSLEFIPKTGEIYTAKINGIIKTYPLPAVNTNGTALRIESGGDSLQITVSTTIITPSTTYYLIGQSRGVVCYAQVISFNNNLSIKKAAAKDQFPTGIARFTLIDQNHQPVNERQVFIDHHDELNISIATDKPKYGIRDSVALSIQVKDKDDKPVQGSFSMAVTDDSQVKNDSLGNNILTNLLLTSDLKGNIEDPNYYFINPKQKQTELDNLMLTQGWVGYNWQDVFYPNNNPISYQPEKEFAINGTVTNVFGKPIEKSNVILISNHPLQFKDTLTNKDGRFIFRDLFPVDTALFKLQARNKNGKEFNVGMTVDGFKAPQFEPVSLQLPWYINMDSSVFKNTRAKAAQLQAIANYNGEGHMMKEVIINAKKIIPGSKNLNGPGESDQVIDEQDIEKAGKMTLKELLEQKIKGFLTVGPWKPCEACSTAIVPFVLYFKKLHFVFDGMDIDYFYSGHSDSERIAYVDGILKYFTAEDVTGIELMYNARYNANYNINLLPTPKFGGVPRFNADAYLEITTRSKQGPFMKVTPGTYLYKTLPFTLPKQFYSPKYTVNNKTVAMGTDMRSTIHWEPNIITDKEGKATISFYSADKLSPYSVMIEGISGDGGIGYSRQKINSPGK